jgi:hypothetical protein
MELFRTIQTYLNDLMFLAALSGVEGRREKLKILSLATSEHSYTVVSSSLSY